MTITTKQLSLIPDFLNVPESQLEWLIQKSKIVTYETGDYIFKKGDSIDKLSIILEGKIIIKFEQNGSFKNIGVLDKNSIAGLLPFSRLSSAVGYGEVVERAQLLRLDRSHFREMVANHYELTESLVHNMTSRVREFTRSNVQSEKMMALGKLSAGLAHELNNPASALLRSAKELKKHLSNVPEKFKRIISIRASEEEVDTINQVLFERINERPENNMKLTERNQKEEELEEWLETHQVENAYELTETFIDFCMGIPEMEKIYEATGDKNFPHSIEWIENALTTEKMVDEIEEASNRIADLVQSVKSYTHMDRGQEKVTEDVHKGIKSTLTMLNHKLKRKNISVDKQFDLDLPHPQFSVSELNQVWTNLIDNAIDAMDQEGHLTIKTSNAKPYIKIEIIDNGEGIPEENVNQIFDPFFTTKGVGEGTGMGLEVVQRIINQHQGEIKVDSKPGNTNFTVCLPFA